MKRESFDWWQANVDAVVKGMDEANVTHSEIVGDEEREIDVTKFGDEGQSWIIVRDRKVEAVAAALRKEQFGGTVQRPWEKVDDKTTKDHWRRLARAAIEAMGDDPADEIIVTRGGKETVYRAVEYRP
jgi:hypothetical protein